jgi:hypothetical protein
LRFKHAKRKTIFSKKALRKVESYKDKLDYTYTGPVHVLKHGTGRKMITYHGNVGGDERDGL